MSNTPENKPEKDVSKDKKPKLSPTEKMEVLKEAKAQILNLASQGNVSPKEIATQLGVDLSIVYQTLGEAYIYQNPRKPEHLPDQDNLNTFSSPRMLQGRDHFSRAAEERPIDWDSIAESKGALWVDPNLAPDGYTIGWIIANEENVQKALQRNRTPVHTSENHVFAQMVGLRREATKLLRKQPEKFFDDAIVEVQGHFLFKCPTYLFKAENKKYQEKAQIHSHQGGRQGVQVIENLQQSGPVYLDPWAHKG